MYVADTGSARVVIFADTSDAAAYGMAAAFVIGGSTTFKLPADVACDNYNIYVSDTGTNRVLVFSTPISITGPVVMGAVGQPNLTNTAANWDGSNGQATADSLSAPLGVYVDRQDTLYVGDAGNNRLLQFPKAVTACDAARFQSGAPVAGARPRHYGRLRTGGGHGHRQLRLLAYVDGEPHGHGRRCPPGAAFAW